MDAGIQTPSAGNPSTKREAERKWAKRGELPRGFRPIRGEEWPFKARDQASSSPRRQATNNRPQQTGRCQIKISACDRPTHQWHGGRELAPHCSIGAASRQFAVHGSCPPSRQSPESGPRSSRRVTGFGVFSGSVLKIFSAKDMGLDPRACLCVKESLQHEAEEESTVCGWRIPQAAAPTRSQHASVGDCHFPTPKSSFGCRPRSRPLLLSTSAPIRTHSP